MANVGSLDRILRAILGVVLIALPFVTDFALWANPIWMYGALAVGAVMLLTAAIRFCPLYVILGLRTCSRS